jgi:phosphatidylserine decarboxylase
MVSFPLHTQQSVSSMECRQIRNYNNECFSLDADAMNYFRAIVLKNERSDRVLELTEHIIRRNPAHYTVW